MLRFLKHICFLLLIVFLTSCISRNVVEDIGLITVRGFDFIDQKVEVTGGMYEFTTDGSQNSTFSGRANTLKGAIDNANRKTSYKLEYGKVQLDLFHKEFAKKGLYPYLDSLGRDAVEPDEMYIAISKEPTKEIITKKKEEMKSVNTDIGQHLHELIKRSSRNDVFPKISYNMFLSNVSDTGKEAILPIFELLEGTPAITSMAVFKDDQYVGEIDITNRIYYALFQKEIKDEELGITLPLEPFLPFIEGRVSNERKLYTSFNVLRGQNTTDLMNKEKLSFQTDISVDLELLEISEQVNLKDAKTIELLEKKAEEKITKQYEQLLDELKELDSDALGYGAIYRMEERDLTQREWDEKFPEIEVEFKVDANIIHHGEHF